MEYILNLAKSSKGLDVTASRLVFVLAELVCQVVIQVPMVDFVQGPEKLAFLVYRPVEPE